MLHGRGYYIALISGFVTRRWNYFEGNVTAQRRNIFQECNELLRTRDVMFLISK